MDEIGLYAKTLDKRMKVCEESMKQTMEMTHELSESLDITQERLKEEFAVVNAQIDMIEKKLQQLMMRSRNIVLSFQDSVHEKEYSRLDARINAFKGEQFITRREFDRWVKEEFSSNEKEKFNSE